MHQGHRAAAPECGLVVGGFVPFSTVDYPGELSCVLFCQGCAWSCRYCQNSHLIPPRGPEFYPWKNLWSFMAARQGLLDAVVFSGGEPLLQRDLKAAMEHVRSLGFKVGLHTAGIVPQRLMDVLPLVDWVALDIKALPADYASLTGDARAADSAFRSLQLILQTGCTYEVRTTVHSALMPESGLLELAQKMASMGVRHYRLQHFRDTGCLDPDLPASRDVLSNPTMVKRIGTMFPDFAIR